MRILAGHNGNVSILEIVTLLFTAFITVDMARYIRKGQIRRDFAALRTLHGWRWLGAIPVVVVLLAVTITVGYFLFAVGGPILQFSWLQLLARPEEKAEAGKNLVSAGLQVPWFAWLFLPLLAANVPRLAKREERAFRQDVRTPKEAIQQSIIFGLWHCLVGVPVAFGLALTIPGLWFAYTYSKGGVRLSTAWHSIYNWTILAIVAVFLALGWL